MNQSDMILSELATNSDYARAVLPHLKEEYFSDRSQKILFKEIESFIQKYNGLPTKEALLISMQTKELDEVIFDSINDQINKIQPSENNLQWLIDSTEKYCKEKAVYNALMESLNIIDDKSKTKTREAIPGLLQDALSVGFNKAIGHDYLNNWESRFSDYTQNVVKIPFDIDLLNAATDGGIERKTLNLILAGTYVGKTLQMCHFASSYLLRGYNVLYITMEIAETKIAQRIDANLLNCEMSQLKHMPQQTFANRIAALQRRVVGQLVVKEFPTSVPNILHFKALLEELKVKKNFVPDIICIDYLNICSSSRYRAGGNTNSYTYVKAIAEELRGLAVETNTAIWSATQTNRDGFGSSDVDMTDTSESFGVPMTADLLYAAISTPELRELNQYLIKMLKNRYFDSDKFQKFVIGVDRPKMRLYNVEQSAQLDEPLFDKTSMGSEIQSRTRRGRKPKSSNNFGEVINEAMEGLIDD